MGIGGGRHSRALSSTRLVRLGGSQLKCLHNTESKQPSHWLRCGLRMWLRASATALPLCTVARTTQTAHYTRRLLAAVVSHCACYEERIWDAGAQWRILQVLVQGQGHPPMLNFTEKGSEGSKRGIRLHIAEMKHACALLTLMTGETQQHSMQSNALCLHGQVMMPH